MILERLYESKYSLRRLQKTPLWELLDGFCEWLLRNGFTPGTTRNLISRVHHLGEYLKQCGITKGTDITAQRIQTFLTDQLPRHKCPRGGLMQRRSIGIAVHRFMKYLAVCGKIVAAPREIPSYQALLDEYVNWMRDYHHVSASTLDLYRNNTTHFLRWLGSDAAPDKLSALDPRKIQSFFIEYSGNRTSAQRQSMTAALRAFCRYCLRYGHITRHLDESVPSFRKYRLSTIPRGITEDNVKALLTSIDRSTKAGNRDYAIIQILSTYGVRGGQVRALRLDDIDWSAGRIRFRAMKHGKELIHPITNAVGGGLLSYLKRARPKRPCPEVFLTDRAPYHPFPTSTSLSRVIQRRMKAAGIASATFGTHIFRHGFASRMLERGYALKPIADMLGHRCLQSTSIYAKVDFHSLSEVALDWPEEGR